MHYRNVPPEGRDVLSQMVRSEVARDAGCFTLTSGHRVWEIRPRVPWHKGRAIKWVLRQLGDPAPWLVCYLGDDRTGEDAFATFPESVTVKVGASLRTHAGYRLPDPAAVEQLLEYLCQKLSGPAESA